MLDDLSHNVLKKLESKDSWEFMALKRKLKSATHQPHYNDFLKEILKNENDKLQFYDSIKPYWHILDVGLLELFIDYICPESQVQMEQYNKMLEQIESQRIAWVANAIQKLDIHPIIEDNTPFHSIIEKIDLDPNKHTVRDLNYLRKVKQQALRKMGLTKCLMTLYTVSLNCVVVTWLVPSYNVESLCNLFEKFVKDGIYLEQNNIISIELNDRIFVTKKEVNYYLLIYISHISGVGGRSGL